MPVPFALGKYPKAILHIDGDAFFASCEQARNPKYQGKPVVTGKERGIASSMSYEAKKLGVTRGMRLFEMKKNLFLTALFSPQTMKHIPYYHFVFMKSYGAIHQMWKNMVLMNVLLM